MDEKPLDSAVIGIILVIAARTHEKPSILGGT
jgi:hypothetical protein